MSLSLELKKLKRTGYIPAFLFGSLLSAAVPVVLMAVRKEVYTAEAGSPLTLLLNAGWQLMAMLHMLLAVCGACIMYHTEYADNAAQKLEALPVRQGNLFFGKVVIAETAAVLGLLLEAAALAFCQLYWFPRELFDPAGLAGHVGFSAALMLPTILLMLVIASACRNMWISLGIGVILIFTFSLFQGHHTLLDLFPFSAPYQLLHNVRQNGRLNAFLLAAVSETVLFGAVEWLLLNIRRCLS